jgi:hypothetical protein
VLVIVDKDEEVRALHRRFVERFRPDPSSQKPVAPGEVSDAEKALDAFFPATLTMFWLAQGYGDVPGVAATASIFPRPANCPPPFERLLSPAEIARETQTPRYAPIPGWIHYPGDNPREDIDRDDAWKYILPIAVDARGRWICMLRHYNIEVDLPIYLFDHNAGDFLEIAPGFDTLLQAYLQLPAAKS